MRICNVCNESLPLSEFYRYKRKNFTTKGIRRYCKTCECKANRENKQLKKEQYAEKRRAYYAKPEIKARVEKYRQSAKATASRRLSHRFNKLRIGWLEKERKRHRDHYNRMKQDPAWVARTLAMARERYRKRKEAKQAQEAGNGRA